jgi:hypothetical protein
MNLKKKIIELFNTGKTLEDENFKKEVFKLIKDSDNKLTDKVWNNLSYEIQLWYNNVAKQIIKEEGRKNG